MHTFHTYVSFLNKIMPVARVELARSYDQMILSHFCLPIPPYRHAKALPSFANCYINSIYGACRIRTHAPLLTAYQFSGLTSSTNLSKTPNKNGQSRSRTCGVSSVDDLQSSAIASRHIYP